ncbi:MAG: IS1634 family transposase [Bacillota bacterium]
MSLVYLKNKKNGITYVYESAGYWDKDKQQARNRRQCIGKLDSVTGEFISSKRFTDAETPLPSKPGPVPSVECKRLFFGATYLFDAIGEKLGITDDLKRCFPESYKKILSIAYYLVMEDRNPMSRFAKWAKTHVHPYGSDIPSQRSSDLFGLIGEDAKQYFFLLQGQRRLEKEFLAYDTTSISSYSRSLKQVKFGWNKEHDMLPQINLALLFGETSRLPVYYRKLPGNIADVKTIQNLLADISFLNLDKVNLVMDRGFYSEENINALYQKHYKFIIAAKTSLRLVKKKLDEVRSTMGTRPHYSSKYGLYYDSYTMDWKYSETKKRTGEVIRDTKRMYLHLYYNDQKATDDKISFNKLLDGLEEELLTGDTKLEHEKLYAKYYDVKETPARGVSFIPRQNAIDAVEKNYGYFALISNGVKDPLDALDIYRSKDMIEKAFGNLKERLNMRRTSVSSEENLEGKLFVQFIALMYLSYINKAMNDNQLFKSYTMQELLDELDVIERFEQPSRRHRIGEMTMKQVNLYKCMGVGVPT